MNNEHLNTSEKPRQHSDAGHPQTTQNEAVCVSELRYRRLFEAARDGILILDLGTGRITDVNPFLIELLGFSREEMMGRTVGELSPFKDVEANQIMLKRLQEHGFVRYEDLPMETRDGRNIAVEFVCNVYQAGDEKVIQCNVRDITERKHAQNEISRLNAQLEKRVAERTEELQTANEQMGAFSYSVSHDLRAPLRHILGFVKLLEDGAGPTLSDENQRHLKTISRAASRMGNLIDDLLAFSRTGQSEMHKRPVNLASLIRDTIEDFQADTKERTIAWEIGALPVVWADRSLMGMVMSNLISNALKFTVNRVQVKIAIDCAPGGPDETVIFIRDNGAGFNPLYIDKLFGVFDRLHSLHEFEGTGIGLANVRRIINRHGGRVWAEGAIDQGATFFFSLPNQREGPHAP